jgi:hypothetical protein
MTRAELPLRRAQAESMGFRDFQTWGENWAGEPFYITATDGTMSIDFGVFDQEDGATIIEVGKLSFSVEGGDAPTGYRVLMPQDLFAHPPVLLEGVTVRPLSPLALSQIRLGIAGQGSFGALNPKQQSSMRRFKEQFFPDATDADLAPRIVRR